MEFDQNFTHSHLMSQSNNKKSKKKRTLFETDETLDQGVYYVIMCNFIAYILVYFNV